MERAEPFRPPTHGGDVDRIAAQYGLPADSILDFSANVNPDGLPERVREDLAERLREPGFLERYPDGECRELAARLAAQHGVDPSSIVVSGGATALIHQSVSAVHASTALFPTPAFSEYRAALDAVRTKRSKFRLREEEAFCVPFDRLSAVLRRRRPALCLINNPHNPSGAIATRDEMLMLLSLTRSLGTLLVVDEAFIDYTPRESIIDRVAGPGLIVIRSLTKFYGIPGMRIGFAAASADVRLREQVPSWPAGRLDTAAAIAALDFVDAEAVRRENALRREALDRGLRERGLRTFPSGTNFVFARLADRMPSTGILKDRLVREQGILVRDCSSYEDLEKGVFLRVAVRRPEENERLLLALDRAL